ncbi:MAG: SDR family oxidoreductase [Hyphomonadaceae bacterium]|nr:SDR family oxidoreductase [Hyphomonadaceae bacterium]
MGRLAGKKAFVTGAAQGLGEATARLFAREGATVSLSDLQLDKARAVAADIVAAGGAAHAFAHDVADPDRWPAVLGEAADAMGGLNILVNNAGVGGNGSVEEETFENWKRVLGIDLDSVFLGCKHAMPLMRATGAPGAIVNISSIAGLIASHNYAAYNAAKAGVWLLSKSVALHGARMTPQIRCNSVHPTFIDTPILDPLKARFGEGEARAKLARQVPLRRLGKPDDVAYMVLFLASDEADFVTGAEFKVDGGISAM